MIKSNKAKSKYPKYVRTQPIEESTQEKEHILVIREDYMYGYSDVIEKIMHLKEPYIDFLLRRKQFENGTYRIRDGRNNRLTQYYVNITDSKKIMWITMSLDMAKNILGTDKPPVYGNYLRDLRKYLGRHDLSYVTSPFLYLHKLEHVPIIVQKKLEV